MGCGQSKKQTCPDRDFHDPAPLWLPNAAFESDPTIHILYPRTLNDPSHVRMVRPCPPSVLREQADELLEKVYDPSYLVANKRKWNGTHENQQKLMELDRNAREVELVSVICQYYVDCLDIKKQLDALIKMRRKAIQKGHLKISNSDGNNEDDDDDEIHCTINNYDKEIALKKKILKDMEKMVIDLQISETKARSAREIIACVDPTLYSDPIRAKAKKKWTKRFKVEKKFALKKQQKYYLAGSL